VTKGNQSRQQPTSSTQSAHSGHAALRRLFAGLTAFARNQWPYVDDAVLWRTQEEGVPHTISSRSGLTAENLENQLDADHLQKNLSPGLDKTCERFVYPRILPPKFVHPLAT
jgi:hypothetical protein